MVLKLPVFDRVLMPQEQLENRDQRRPKFEWTITLKFWACAVNLWTLYHMCSHAMAVFEL